MVANAFTMMMGAARKKSKPALPLEVVDVAPVVKITKRLGRPPAVKKALDLTPLGHDLTSTRTKVRRQGYDTGHAKIAMAAALFAIRKANGKNCKRTADVYRVNRKS
jgi:hypothetical protein